MNIIVNAQEHEFSKEKVTYDDILELAGKSGAPTCTWSIRGKDGSHMGGQLFSPTLKHPNHSITAVEGMIINCAHTNRA